MSCFYVRTQCIHIFSLNHFLYAYASKILKWERLFEYVQNIRYLSAYSVLCINVYKHQNQKLESNYPYQDDDIRNYY